MVHLTVCFTDMWRDFLWTATTDSCGRWKCWTMRRKTAGQQREGQRDRPNAPRARLRTGQWHSSLITRRTHLRPALNLNQRPKPPARTRLWLWATYGLSRANENPWPAVPLRGNGCGECLSLSLYSLWLDKRVPQLPRSSLWSGSSSMQKAHVWILITPQKPQASLIISGLTSELLFVWLFDIQGSHPANLSRWEVEQLLLLPFTVK